MGLFWLKYRDTRPILEVALKDPALPDGSTPAHDLTGATLIKLHIRRSAGGSVLSRDMTVEGAPTLGVLRYTWVASDWDTPGLVLGDHLMEYEVVSGTSRLTFPNDGNDTLRVVADLGQAS